MFPSREEALASDTHHLGRKRVLSESEAQGMVSDSAYAPQKRVKASHGSVNDAQNLLAPSNDLSSKREVVMPLDSPRMTRPMIKVEQGNTIRPLVSWNQGVQSGLRTSFTSKSKTQPPSTSIVSTASNATDVPMASSPDLLVGELSNIACSDQGIASVSAAAVVKQEHDHSPLKGGVVAQPVIKRETSNPEPPAIQPKETSMAIDHLLNDDDGTEEELLNDDDETGEQCLAAEDIKMLDRTTIDTDGVNDSLLHCPLAVASTQAIYPHKLTKRVVYSAGKRWGICQVPEPLEVLRDGKHIALQDLTLIDFLPSWMKLNLDVKGALRHSHIREAFQLYMNSYYPPDGQREEHVHRAMVAARSKDTAPHIVRAHAFANSKAIGEKKQQKKQEKSTAKLKQMQPAKALQATQQQVRKQTLETAELKQTTATTANPPNPTIASLPPPISISQPRHGTKLTSSSDYYQLSPNDVVSHNHEVSTMANILADIIPVARPRAELRDSVASNTQVLTLGLEQSHSDDNRMNGTQLMGSAIVDEEIQLVREYLPSMEINTERLCLRCAACGHTSFTCPYQTCSTCGEKDTHVSSACPQAQRCGKCLLLGHSMEDCLEKLLPAKSDTPGCKFCHSRDHLEIGCHEVWRSFQPQLDDIKKVCDIPLHCYACGGPGHYGPECGLHKTKLLSGGITWSKANFNLYYDSQSNDQGLSTNTDYSDNFPKPRLSIKGKSRHYVAEESEDDIRFFGARVPTKPSKKPVNVKLQPKQQSKIGGGFGRSQNSGRGHNSGGGGYHDVAPPRPECDYPSAGRNPNFRQSGARTPDPRSEISLPSHYKSQHQIGQRNRGHTGPQPGTFKERKRHKRK